MTEDKNPKQQFKNQVFIIKPTNSWFRLDLSEIWSYRDLLVMLAVRDLKLRYKQTVLGAIWAISQPLFTVLIFTIFFGNFASVPSDNVPYPLFSFAGILPWTFFNNGITKSVSSLVSNSNLVTKVYFPRIILPISSLFTLFLDFFIAFIFLVLMLFYFKIGFSINLLMFPFLFFLMAILTLGLGMLLSSLNVKYRDIGQATPFLIQIGFFLSPIIYPVSIIPQKWSWLLALNPMTGLIEGFRSSLFGKDFDFFSLSLSVGISVLFFLLGVFVFNKMEDEFADVI